MKACTTKLNVYICTQITTTLKHNIMTTLKKDKQTNKISFYRNGKQVFDFKIKGNIVSFSNGDIILI